MNIFELIATATKQMLDCVTERLCMKEPTLIGANVDRSNIKYSVGRSNTTQAELCKILADELINDQANTVKTVLLQIN